MSTKNWQNSRLVRNNEPYGPRRDIVGTVVSHFLPKGPKIKTEINKERVKKTFTNLSNQNKLNILHNINLGLLHLGQNANKKLSTHARILLGLIKPKLYHVRGTRKSPPRT